VAHPLAYTKCDSDADRAFQGAFPRIMIYRGFLVAVRGGVEDNSLFFPRSRQSSTGSTMAIPSSEMRR
jgi:hypothetical protein